MAAYVKSCIRTHLKCECLFQTAPDSICYGNDTYTSLHVR